MEKIHSLYDKIYNPKVIEAGRILFYIGLLFEMVIFFLDRADWYNPYQSLMFRVPFVLFFLKCAFTKYDKRQWLFIILTVSFSFVAYRLTLKDEMIRTMVFIISMKDIDSRRALKFNYFCCLFGVILLGLLAVMGVCGDVISMPGYGYKATAFMLSMGLGSSNTWGIQIWLLTALFVYLYYKRLPNWSYGVIAVLGVIVYILTKCKTELIMMLFTALLGYLYAKLPQLRRAGIIYFCGAITTLICVAFSVYCASISTWWEYQTPIQRKLDILLTGRITSIYPFENGGGVLSNWRLFGAPNFVEYFDMGIVRLFWWYGIIPGIIAVMAVIWLMYIQYRKQDYSGFILLITMILFTVYEAHFVSPFIARNYFLFMIGGVWAKQIHDLNPNESKHIAFYIGSLAKGGAERVFCNLAEYFLSIGYEVTMITQYIREDEYTLPEGAKRVISDLTVEETKGRLYNFFGRVYKLHKVIRDTNADLLMTTIGKANFMAITCAAFTPTRVVVSVVADPKEEYPNKIMKLLLQTLFGEADGIIMQTTDQQKFLRYGLQKESVILPNSVSPVFARPPHIRPDNQNLAMVGRMDDNKNQEMVIRAFRLIMDKYPDARLILMGDGDRRQYLEDLTEDLGLSHKVTFTGIVSDVADRLEGAYAFLLTSNTEGMPNTLLEAMSLGLPCISTDCPCGGPKDIIEDKVTGLLIPVGDVEACAAAMDSLLSDKEFAKTVGANAYDEMLNYRPDVVNAKWRDYYLGIINS